MLNSYKEARINKDKNYDGKFFFGVKTTGVFCRPSCPSPTANEENTVYFDSMFNALNKGYRPCRRCRPDLTIEYYNSNINGTVIVRNALDKIYKGFLNEKSISDLADEFNISDRHLRKLFIDNIGIPPVKAANYHKALFAKKLITYTNHSITEIAFSSGFNSIRQFNDVYQSVFGMTPTETKRSAVEKKDSGTKLILYYKNDFDYNQILDFMRPRIIKGIETADNKSYSRTFRIETAVTSSEHKEKKYYSNNTEIKDNSENKSSTQNSVSKGYFTVINNPEISALELTIHADNIKCCMELYYRVRKMFDLDTDYSVINEKFKKDEYLKKGMKNNSVPGLPAAFDPYEFTVRAILGQQITVKAATTLAGRIAEKSGLKTPGNFPDGLDFFFPSPEEMIETDLEGLGITGIRQKTINTVTEALVNNLFSLTRNQSLEKFETEFSALKGIGSWTVHYTAMRGLGMTDSFPARDLGIIKALSFDGKKPKEKEILEIAEKWRPWRAYAALCLWNSL